MRSIKIVCLFILILISRDEIPANPPSQVSFSPDTLVLNDRQNFYPLLSHMEILEDPSARLSITDVTSSPWREKFSINTPGKANFGFTDSAYWVKFKVKNESRRHNLWLLTLKFPNMHYIDFYAPSKNGKNYIAKKSGILRPAATRDISFTRFTFTLPLAMDKTKMFYSRFKAGSSMRLKLAIRSPEAFAEKTG